MFQSAKPDEPAMDHAIYNGQVVHTRTYPVHHRLRYGVFSLLLDVGKLGEADRRARLFSVNRFNLLSFHESDHGDGGPLHAYLFDLAQEAGCAHQIARFQVLAYPRILGYAFNPLTTYYGLNSEGRIAFMVYEVRNTFSQRITYAIPADGAATIRQSCDKALYVSPFNPVAGRYRFALAAPGEKLGLSIALEQDGRTILTASFAGVRANLSDREIAFALFRTGWMSLKVILAIHFEALKLWLKGLGLVPRPKTENDRVIVEKASQAHPDAAE